MYGARTTGAGTLRALGDKLPSCARLVHWGDQPVAPCHRGSVHRQTNAAVAIAVMARSPRRGGVKTRLAADIGGEAAYRVYCRLLLQTMALVESVGAGRPILALASEGDAEVARTPASTVRLLGSPHPCLHPESWSVVQQRGDGLGERLANVFADLFAAGHEAVVLVNGDSPALPKEYLQRALRLLHEGVEAGHKDEVVLGPATDGGFYLIGAHRETWEAVCEAAGRAAARTPSDSAAPNAIAARPRGRAHGNGRRGRDAHRRALGRRPARAPAAALARRRRRRRPPGLRAAHVERAADGIGVRPERGGGLAPGRRRSPARGAARRTARDLPPRHQPLRARLPALLQPHQPPRPRRADDLRVARRHRPVRGARRLQLRLPGRRPASARRPLRPHRARHRHPPAQGAHLLQRGVHGGDGAAVRRGRARPAAAAAQRGRRSRRSTTSCAATATSPPRSPPSAL